MINKIVNYTLVILLILFFIFLIGIKFIGNNLTFYDKNYKNLNEKEKKKYEISIEDFQNFENEYIYLINYIIDNNLREISIYKDKISIYTKGNKIKKCDKICMGNSEDYNKIYQIMSKNNIKYIKYSIPSNEKINIIKERIPNQGAYRGYSYVLSSSSSYEKCENEEISIGEYCSLNDNWEAFNTGRVFREKK